MKKVTDLCCGWALHAEWAYRVNPVLSRHPTWQLDLLFCDGRRRYNPADFESVPEARQVFREVKRQLDIMDKTRGVPLLEFRRATLERAKLALEFSLKRACRWSEELLETGVPAL